MTKRDYLLLAYSLKAAREVAVQMSRDINQFDCAVYAVCNALKLDNVRFDQDKFIRAVKGE